MDRNSTDKHLIKAIQQGDEHAFEILFKSYYSDLKHMANGIVKDMAVADELVSDVFFNIWQKRTQIQIHTSVFGYLKVAIRNHALNNLKATKPDWVVIDDKVTNTSDRDQNPAQQMINEESWQFWQRKIGQLPPQRQKVFRMNKLEGFTYAEIACLLSISEKTVRNQVQIALRSLREVVISYAVLFLL